MKKAFLLAVVFLAVLAAPSVAKEAPKNDPQTKLSIQDKKDVARIEEYLNGLKNISANFLQLDDAGGIMRGQIEISRPGKLRVTYDPPNKDFIIATGHSVHIWDDDLKAQTNLDQEASLAAFILQDPIKLDAGDVNVIKIERFPAKIEVSVVQKNDPAAGSLILVFEDKPLKLRQWKIVDAQGRTTGINLENMSEPPSFPRSTFVFIPPSFVKNR